MRREESFGIVPLRKCDGEWQVFLIQHRRDGYWGLPKGHAEPGETPQATASRELKEETNLDCERFLREEPFVEEYRFFIEGKPVVKKVFYFAAEVEGEAILQKEEINDGTWLPYKEALGKITHFEAREILIAVEKNLPHS